MSSPPPPTDGQVQRRNGRVPALAIQEHNDFDGFEAGLREAMEGFRSIGDQFMTAVCLDLRAELAESRGDLDGAIIALDEALDIVSVANEVLRSRAARPARSGCCPTSRRRRRAGRGSRPRPLRRCRVPAGTRRSRSTRWRTSVDTRAVSSKPSRRPSRRSGSTATHRRWFSSSFSRAGDSLRHPRRRGFGALGARLRRRSSGDVAEAIERHRAAYHEVAGFPHPRTMAVSLEGLAAAAVPFWRARAGGPASRVQRRTSAHVFDAAATPAEQEDIRRSEQAAMAGLGDEAYGAARRSGAKTSPDDLVT